MKVSGGVSGHSRHAILRAFRDVVLENRLREIRVVELVRRAGVARSTFYEHFDSLEDVLRESLQVPLGVLAATARGKKNGNALEFLLNHMLERRTDALALLDGEAGSMVRNTLADMIGGSPVTAYAVAGAQLATIAAWLEGRLPVSIRCLAAVLERLPEL